jgi:hypothetical protein
MDGCWIGMSNWMRGIFFVSGIINVLGALMFVPQIGFGHRLLGLAEVAPVYLWIIVSFILLFGIGYFYLSVTGRRESLFVYIAATGKIVFAIILWVYVLKDQLSLMAIQSALTDFVLGVIFLIWLYQTRLTQ